MFIRFVKDVCKAFPWRGAKSVKPDETKEMHENRLTSLLVFSGLVFGVFLAISLAFILTDVGRFILSMVTYVCIGVIGVLLVIATVAFVWQALHSGLESYFSALSLMVAGVSLFIAMVLALLLLTEFGRILVSTCAYCIMGGISFLMIMLVAACCIELVHHYEEYAHKRR